ncbi:type II toxin-antitoxin system ParD family antitoxin [Rhizobium leguminosarum]|uniref:type II toxin-antitoxin system ParD family antitoxin n=1 Tax=Rhizobium leguminosarum TaxID=384 RepID=UPI001C9597F6|nr:type II toxin-antitoxin system ParD family antitoxin [Rhizobium leguminosarum]MBY5609589.1 type II toxin-antitoxin system ParD family antitoxin [Rhizobium leguminosarum]MBY5616283.1 type II toxin-antitoxin system ParD family antitoxin [Rhizobium leguminosarum]MBY5649173.1 type II toxin-antitoxin system ParD family antitoxin [Rhizobium leguminosarum]MBY5655162.1 type II toxin-antitoxin system ParD family antitoxin [Rhizobium leguminosarum]MBY5671637.1 type II toxin-antitoxin system ParD fami
MPSSYNIGPRYECFVRELVESGRYASASEVMRDSLRLLEQREEIRALDLEKLKREYAEGKASGEPKEVDAVAFLQELKAGRAARGKI